jgi:hypothetical protein
MKVLITGSTSPQASAKTAGRIPTFATLMAHSLISQGIHTELVEPTPAITEEVINEFDYVLVGIAPPTSLSANRLYPAFAIANRALRSGKLLIFIDAPEPYKIQASLKSCHLNVSDLQKDFYRMRKFYHDFVEQEDFQREVYDFIDFLYTQPWPAVLFPAFPWSTDEPIRKALPNAEHLIPINLDSELLSLERISHDLDSEKTYWTCDAPQTRWAKKVSRTLVHPVFPNRRRRWDAEDVTLGRMRKSVGTLVSLYRSDEVWWSPALAQSLSVGVPVATDWRKSQMLGPEWGFLASSIESMSTGERFELAIAQRDFYVGAVNEWDKTIKNALTKQKQKV